jgi:hypothetical protein
MRLVSAIVNTGAVNAVRHHTVDRRRHRDARVSVGSRSGISWWSSLLVTAGCHRRFSFFDPHEGSMRVQEQVSSAAMLSLSADQVFRDLVKLRVLSRALGEHL